MSELLSLKDIKCSIDGLTVVNGVNMQVNKGNLVCLLGPSGCGKTTVLRAIAGFQSVDEGEISLHEQLVSAKGFMQPPEKRRVGMVFQDYALFPHLTVGDNVSFGIRHLPPAERADTVNRMLALVGLDAMKSRYPHELSGGQQQRVALARALAPKPDLILMDEPFSNLDVELRERVSYEVRDILKQQGATAVLVTHDQHEAFALGDQVGVMNNGRILQWDTPYNLYHEPCCAFIAEFIGQGVFLPGVLTSPDIIETEIGHHRGNRSYNWETGSKVELLLRPDDIIADPESDLRATVTKKAFKGAEILYTLKLKSGAEILSVLPSHADHGIGDELGIRVETDHLVAFPQRQQ
ncbi:MAG: ABC transporter ATP-binding protein [Gammaproteobacteria bacterium]|nr:ABC transporter ATP-binding protein [Gammaproteobacteria bacterium]